MYSKVTNKERVLSQIDFVIHEIQFAIDTTKDVPDETYFGTTETGMILFRSSCMCIQNISEGFRQIDMHTKGELLPLYKEVPWKLIKGIRNLLAHEYLSVEEPEILSILHQDLPKLLPVAVAIKKDTEEGKHDKLFSQKNDR